MGSTRLQGRIHRPSDTMSKSLFEQNFHDAVAITLLPETMCSCELADIISAVSSYERVKLRVAQLRSLYATAVLGEQSHGYISDLHDCAQSGFRLVVMIKLAIKPSFSICFLKQLYKSRIIGENSVRYILLQL